MVSASPSSRPELEQHAEVVEPGLEAGEPVQVGLEHREPAGHPGGVRLVVPQVGGGHLLTEVGDLGADRAEVQHLLDGVHRRLELLDLGLEIWACHNTQLYATRHRRTASQVCMHPRGHGYPGRRRAASRRGAVMPQQAWSKKRERQYDAIKDSLEDRGRDEDTAAEIAARTVNKERARAGESEQASRTSTEDLSSGRRGGLRSHRGAGGRTKAQLYNEARSKGIKGRSSMSKAELERALDR